MQGIFAKGKVCAALAALLVAAALAMGGASAQTAFADTAQHGNGHHATQTVKKPGKAKVCGTSCTTKACTVKWNKVSGASGYEIKCTPKSGGKAVTKKAGKSATKATVSGLKAGCKYTVQVRAYKTANGAKSYGAWSAKKTVTVKKAAKKSSSTGSYVYITNTGKKYHVNGCRHLAKSKHKISLADAKRQGYTACKNCC